ncbi:MAG TPA: O-methyltransferase [Planctomycetota bacterium]|nr:O-methyltransferase [Planctomycetota bacterium]
MSGILDSRVAKYLEDSVPPRGSVLEAMEREAKRRDIPIVGPQVGRVLAALAAAASARRVFELGSAIGYSTLWLCLGAHPRARIHYTDRSEACAEEARVYLDRAGFAKQVRIHVVPDSVDALAVTPGEFDLIFVDLDKESYPRALKAAIPRLRIGGLYIADNALWSGRVADGRARDAETRALREHNRLALSDERLVGGILPVRDGLFVGTRIL